MNTSDHVAMIEQIDGEIMPDWDAVMPRLTQLIALKYWNADIVTALNWENDTTAFTVMNVGQKRKQLYEKSRTRRRHIQCKSGIQSRHDPKSVWNSDPRIIPAARQLWNAGWKMSAIGPELNRLYGTSFTKNAVAGKVHRLAFAERPSPIANSTTWTDDMHTRCMTLLFTLKKPQKVAATMLTAEFGMKITKSTIATHLRKLRKSPAMPIGAMPTLPPLQSLTPAPKPAITRKPLPRTNYSVVPSRPVYVPKTPPPPPPPARVVTHPAVYGRVVRCMWPIGEPGTKSFRFCDENSKPGKSYCADHYRLAYIKRGDDRDTGEAA